MGTRSAMMPRIGLLIATILAATTADKLQTELPVNVMPQKMVFSPNDSLNK